MKKLPFILILGILPTCAFAYRTGQGTCEPETPVPLGYCCISYEENGSISEHLWNCDNLDFDSVTMAACKSEKFQCINYCMDYDLDNDTCSSNRCDTTEEITDSEDCTISHAALCDYDLVCTGCYNKTCHHYNETVWECDDEHYYVTTDRTQCLKCPGNGVVDFDMGNDGIATCYIPRNPMTGSDTTGTFQYVNDKCHYKE